MILRYKFLDVEKEYLYAMYVTNSNFKSIFQFRIKQ